MSIQEEESLVFDDLPECPEGLNLSESAQSQVAAWTDKFGRKLLEQVDGILTVLDLAIMNDGKDVKDGKDVPKTAVGLTPAITLNVKNENTHLTDIAAKAAVKLGKPDVASKIRAIFVFLLRRGLNTFKDKECLPGTNLTYKRANEVLGREKQIYDRRIKEKPAEIPEDIFTQDLKAETAIKLVQELILTHIPEKIKGDPSEMRERIVRAVNHAKELYKHLGNYLFQEGPKVERMYNNLVKGELKLPDSNPLTALDNATVGSQGFTSLAWNFLKGLESSPKSISKKEAEDLYHTQVILWLSLVFFQLNLHPARSKAELRTSIGREVTNLITQELQGAEIVEKTETIDGKQEPFKLRKIHVNGHEYLVYAGEKSVQAKGGEATLLKIMRSKEGKEAFTIVDETRGELVVEENADAFYEGSEVVNDANTILANLAKQLGCTVMKEGANHNTLSPGQAVIKSKLGESAKPESFKFATVKAYYHLQFCETANGSIVLIKDEATKRYALTNNLAIHTARLEYRIIPKDTWLTGQYDENSPSHHDFYRLQQIIEIVKLVVRPAENPELYAHMEVLEQMLDACKKKIKEKRNQG